MRQIDMQWQYRQTLATGIGFAKDNVWSRAARRKKKHGSRDENPAELDEDTEDEPYLGVKIQLKSSEENRVTATIRWLQGRDNVLFESFCGMLKRQMNTS